MFVTTQISMSVTRTTEIVMMMQAAPTIWVASRVLVYLDTMETVSSVQVT